MSSKEVVSTHTCFFFLFVFFHSRAPLNTRADTQELARRLLLAIKQLHGGLENLARGIRRVSLQGEAKFSSIHFNPIPLLYSCLNFHHILTQETQTRVTDG